MGEGKFILGTFRQARGSTGTLLAQTSARRSGGCPRQSAFLRLKLCHPGRGVAASEVSSVKHVVIVGGGFAGLNCARTLAASSDVLITLLDKNNYQQFQPLLYQVATAALAPADVAFNCAASFATTPTST